MVWIFSYSKNDRTIKSVQEWIYLMKKKSIVSVLHQDYIELIKIIETPDSKECIIRINEKTLNTKEIESIWFKGGSVELIDFIRQDKAKNQLISFKDNLRYYLSAYSTAKLEVVLNVLSKKKVLGANLLGRFNKINALSLAKDVGLSIPPTIVTGNRKDIEVFVKTYGDLVCKSLDLNFDYYDVHDESWFHSYTTNFSIEDLEKMPDNFAISAFQKKIEKKYEIRTFYLNNKCYSMAIFSQLNYKTMIDYRRYDSEKMNRIVPYKLPLSIKHKVVAFMKRANLKTGSIDLIKSNKNEFVFLEVNPIGQFGYLSGNCNYYLEKEIAMHLTNNQNEK